MKKLFFSAVAVLFTKVAMALPVAGSVKGTSALPCATYLYLPEGKTDLPLVVTLNGTGMYSTGSAEEITPAVGYMMEKEGKVAVLTIDKPGISFNQSKDSKFDIDFAVYDLHTQRDLVSCVQNAIAWAYTQPQLKTDGNIFMVGHSEGSQVIIRVLKSLKLNSPTIYKRVRSVFLSGLPMSGWNEIIKKQLSAEDFKKFQTALKKGDNETLRSMGGVPAKYWQDIFSTEPLSQTLENSTQDLDGIDFQISQGLEDANTQAAPVLKFEKDNAKRRLEGKPSLRFTARYYNAGHGLNGAAVNDLIFALLAYTSQN